LTKTQAHSDSKPRKKRTTITYVKYFAGLLLLLVLGLAMIVVIRFRNDAEIPYTVSTAGITIPTYDEIEIDFTHNYVKAISVQTTCGAAIDLDGGAEELFLCGGQGQGDVIFRYEHGTFKDITTEVSYVKEDDEASMSATSLDVDKDGDNDLIVTRTSSIWLYTNEGGKLTGQKLDAPIADDTTPISIAVADINRDGAFDMYVSAGHHQSLNLS